MKNCVSEEIVVKVTSIIKLTLELLKPIVNELYLKSANQDQRSSIYYPYINFGLCELFKFMMVMFDSNDDDMFDSDDNDVVSSILSSNKDLLRTILMESLLHDVLMKISFIRIFSPIIVQWKDYSGNVLFPVHDPDDTDTPDKSFLKKNNKFKGAYGKKRVELFEFVYEQFNADPETFVRQFLQSQLVTD